MANDPDNAVVSPVSIKASSPDHYLQLTPHSSRPKLAINYMKKMKFKTLYLN